jgi:hypothetical protein
MAMVHDVNNGADAVDAMRDGLEWDDMGPLDESGLQGDEAE